ncbi:hypothetical protein GMST_03730 [Geomonas silvestris]|uniref:Uncharacterized protein n=1 Tax=Geomonas silvestris TaxID=2740184 RepID=A0A6V8MDH3_9BACT|nr:hypothetical protein GMST_03730 [Geomonas silvestris]
MRQQAGEHRNGNAGQYCEDGDHQDRFYEREAALPHLEASAPGPVPFPVGRMAKLQLPNVTIARTNEKAGWSLLRKPERREARGGLVGY